MPGLQQFQLKVQYAVLTQGDIALQYLLSEKCNGLNSVKFKDFFFFKLHLRFVSFWRESTFHL